jgi:hypothetical protein
MNPSGSVKTLEVTRWRKGSKQDITFHCSPGVYLDGRLAPGSVALRVGRPMVLVHYRSDGHPHHVYLWSDHDTVRGIIDSVDLKAGKLNVSLTDRLTGEKTGKTRMLKIDARGRVELDGRPSDARKALQVGRRVAVFPARGRLIRAFAPNRKNKLVFNRGGKVSGTVAGERESLATSWRMQRLDLYLGHGFTGPTNTAHRTLLVSITLRNGQSQKVTLHNFASHRQGPAWRAEVIKHDLNLKDGTLGGKLVIDVKPMPEDRPAPLNGGRYAYTLKGKVVANKVAGTTRATLQGKNSRQLPLNGSATGLGPKWIDPGNAAYTLRIEDPQRRVKPLTLHLETRNNEFTKGIASTRAGGAFDVDVSQLQLQGSRVRGAVKVTMPVSRTGLPGDGDIEIPIEVDATVTGGNRLRGRFKGRWGKPDESAE